MFVDKNHLLAASTATPRKAYGPEEWAVRVDLAAAYRLVHEYG